MQGVRLFITVTAVLLWLPVFQPFRQIQDPVSLGTETGKRDPVNSPAFTIGLLTPAPDDISARQAAEMAIEEVNGSGGSGNPQFNLVTRTTDGMWGTGSKESVHLVFDDNVVAYMGSLDGRNAHLAEQVATKTKVAFLSTRATDMSLSYAFVPWFFRCIPDDRHQAEALLQEILVRQHRSTLAIIGSSDNDATLAVRTMVKTGASMGLPTPLLFTIPATGKGIDNPFPEIEQAGTDAILFVGPPALVHRLMPMYRQQQLNIPLFGTLSVLDDPKTTFQEWKALPEMTVISPQYYFTASGQTFSKKFISKFGYAPGVSAAYAYDGIRMLIRAIRKAGNDRDKVIEVMSKTTFTGITGEIAFDKWGNRKGRPSLMTIDQGKPVPLKETP